MTFEIHSGFTCFSGRRLVAGGDAVTVAAAAVQAEAAGSEPVLIFDNRTGKRAELDRRHTPPVIFGAEPPVAETPPPPAAPTRGRPKLGVTAREVTLMPRHWQWLEGQAGGASAALRRLVDQARRDDQGGERAREAQGAVYAVMSVLAGDLAGFEDASRALFARDDGRFDDIVQTWPADIGVYLCRLAAAERASRG
jgi:hypothetical protein